MESNPSYKSLVDMGMSQTLVKASIKQLKTEDIGKLLDWIEQNSNDQEKWADWLEKNPGDASQEVKQEPQSISSLVNADMNASLQSKGHSKNASEKALLFTNNVSVQSAEAWIEQHKYDADFQEQLKLTGQAFQQSNMTEEQAKQKLKQLTEKARENRKKREEQDEREREKNRVRYGKEMTEAKRIAEEQALKRKAELDKIEKKRDQDYKKKLVDQMRRQRQEKLGIKPTGENPSATVEKKVEKPKLNRLEQLELQCEQVRVGMHAYPDKAKVFFETAQIYVNNVVKNNGEEKFRKINKENKAFQNRVAEVFGGVETLAVIGYQDEGNALFMKDYNLNELNKFLEILKRYQSYY